MPVFTDFPAPDSCLRCQGGERCPWHSGLNLPPPKIEGPPKDQHGCEISPEGKPLVADLPPELFYNYNPSGKAITT
ncbi:Hypothetical protein NTJ_00087 [Nesidiocoris tenuis]|nr:Hypothetical protein NTJ_00087 [Nesidiocoris tenuis]